MEAEWLSHQVYHLSNSLEYRILTVGETPEEGGIGNHHPCHDEPHTLGTCSSCVHLSVPPLLSILTHAPQGTFELVVVLAQQARERYSIV